MEINQLMKYDNYGGNIKDGKLSDCCIKSKTYLEQFYSCEECDIFLHKTCLELTKKKQHPLRPHPLTFPEKHPIFGGLFLSNGCHQQCHGFTYSCVQCDFNLDIGCLPAPIATLPWTSAALCYGT
ncbi:hypothetical protein GQ457_06G024290 [Hibiscus cannabinus]